MSNHSEIAEAKVLDALISAESATDLHRLAAKMVVSGISQGYCECTENAELMKLVKEHRCSWCGRLHRSVLHDTYVRMSQTKEWEAAEKSVTSYSPSVYRLMVNADLRLLEDPQEY